MVRGENVISDKGFPFDVDTGLVMCPVCGSNTNAVIEAVRNDVAGCEIRLRCDRQHDWQLGLQEHGGNLFLAVARDVTGGCV
jgi:hypothetical protein